MQVTIQFTIFNGAMTEKKKSLMDEDFEDCDIARMTDDAFLTHWQNIKIQKA
jgi:hypothetical protein